MIRCIQIIQVNSFLATSGYVPNVPDINRDDVEQQRKTLVEQQRKKLNAAS